jgi:hypothetical protein
MVIGVYNPVGEIAETASMQSTTMRDLQGKSVGFVCNNHPAITELWAQLEKSIERDFLPAAVHRIAKPNISMAQPVAQLAGLAAQVDYALVGVGA